MNDAADIATLEGMLAHTFTDRALALQALTRKSHAHEARVQHNERLEFLGDSILQSATTLLLFERFPDVPEGTLHWLRTELVRTERVAEMARRLGLGPLLRVGRGEEKCGGRERESVLADALEAVLGALFLEAGLPACKARVEQWIAADLDQFAVEIAAKGHGDASKNARNRLQELALERQLPEPRYEELSVTGPAHERMFEYAVHLGDRLLATGRGASKKSAAHEAASRALDVLRPPHAEPTP